MRKIHITGNAGSGKSHLAAQISRLTGIDVYGLDSIVWQSGWKSTPPDERKRLEQELILKSS